MIVHCCEITERSGTINGTRSLLELLTSEDHAVM